MRALFADLSIDQSGIRDYALVARSARLVVDTRNALARQRRRWQER